MILLVARLIQAAFARRAQIAIGAGAGAITDIINLDWLRQQSIRIAPGSDREALEEAARLAARLLGLEGDEILWPRQRNGDPIPPKYLIVDLNRGRGWFSTRYYSRKSVRGAQRRGSSRGFRAGQRNIATISQAQRG